ncbi:MAG: hypothetical protein GX620_05575 [Chloroflexi bacterium]|nr:hypothetical protein [Chloroflexota bacterium]
MSIHMSIRSGVHRSNQRTDAGAMGMAQPCWLQAESQPHVSKHILGGYAHDDPVLVTAQGTYGNMFLQGWDPGLRSRWQVHIPKESPGARSSHTSPITDLDQDGIEEIMWGEQCIELDGGTELFCADSEVYRGHSNIGPIRNSLIF